jgi:hypothetical protein
MHSLRGKRGLFSALALALATAMALPSPASAGPDKNATRTSAARYRLFAGNLGAITVNRVYYGLNTRGEVGVDSTNSSTIGGGFWPKGTGNQYMFNSGLQVAGIVTGGADNPWAGDTTGGFFFDARGTNQHGSAVTEIANFTNPVDVANWPQAAYVPQGDASEELFDPLLRGRVSASQGDVWFMSSEADPSLNAGRPHPLGVIAEYRVLGWNFPTGNEDLLYLIITFYNVTTSDPAAYAQYRPGLREILIQEAQLFQTRNNAAFDVTLPTGGYTIDPFYAAFSADPDVTSSAGDNYSSVNLPFAMGYAYHHAFPRQSGWTFPPDINGAPFFPGVGFVGIKYLKSATGPGAISLFTNTQNGGTNFPDPINTTKLYKYMSGEVTLADGVQCNHGDPTQTHICFIANTGVSDVRLMQSSTPFALEAGQSASIVVSYIHAAPVQIPGYTQGTFVQPQDPRRLSDVGLLSVGANRVDSLMGFAGYSDANADGIVQQNEFETIQGSLLNKAILAQEIFDTKFLLPFAPESPEFFLIPGDGSVTVMWRPSSTEEEGDPFFEVAKDALVVPEGGGAPVPSALYDANYRKFDVEGYRIYRGRADTPTSLQLIAQFDYAGTTFLDYTGQVPNLGTRCAPELGLTTSCANVFDVPGPGIELVKNRAYDINGNFVQINRGQRTLLASGDVYNLTADTAVVGRGTGFPLLSNTGVPFLFVDNDVTNGLTYFYAVTAFDINSINSTGAGNTSLESARITQRVVPGTRAGNYSNEGSIVLDGVYGRGVKLTDNVAPTIDPATGMFSKKALPANGYTATINGLVSAVLRGSGAFSIRLDSLRLGDPETANVGHTYFLSVGSADQVEGRSVISLVIDNAETVPPAAGYNAASTGWAGGVADPELAALYGGGEGFKAASGTFGMRLTSGYYLTVFGRGCVNSAPGFGGAAGCHYNGARWFSGANETKAHPNAGNFNSFGGGTAPADLNNAGELPGVVTIMQLLSYENQVTAAGRRIEAVFSGDVTAGDFQVYWGDAGKVDSVIDVTHNVPVPFTGKIGGSWGIVNASSMTAGIGYDQRPSVVTISDISCVPGAKTNTGIQQIYACPAASTASLSETAVPAPIALQRVTAADARTRAPQANNGIVFYLKGYVFAMELAGGTVPAAGSVWTMRSYIGAIRGGSGAAGDNGPYEFTPIEPRSFTAVGAEVRFTYNITNENVASSQETLAQVHTVPDPYYVTSAYEATTTSKIIKFVNLPSQATIRIYTTSGVLVRVLQHTTTTNSGEATWDVRNRNNQFVASGVYFYHVTAENGESSTGRMTIINYAP